RALDCNRHCLAVFRNHSAAGCAVLSITLLACVRQRIRIHLFNRNRVVRGVCDGSLRSVVFRRVHTMNRSTVRPFPCSGYLYASIRCFTNNSETLDRWRGTELRFVHVELPCPEG